MMEAEKEEKELTTHVSILPPETVGQVLRKLSVVDRLQCEGVNRRWKAAAWDLGWTEQTKLSREIVFEGASESQQKKFDNDSLAALFHRVGASLIELDMREFNLREAVAFLPNSLIDLHSNGPFDGASLTVLSMSCPHLESIHFYGGGEHNNEKVSVSAMNTFVGKFQKSLKVLHLAGDFIGSDPNHSLTSLGQLEWLETLQLEEVSVFDDAALTAVATGCRRLRTLRLDAIGVSEEALNGLEEHPTLLDFELERHPTLSETLQKSINGRWKTKKYKYLCSQLSTGNDNFILVKVLSEITAALKLIPSTTASARPIIGDLIAWGLLPLLVKSLSSRNAELQLGAALLLTRITYFGTSAQKGAVVEARVVPELLKLLGSADCGHNVNFLREQLLRVLGNIIIDCQELRDRCVELGIPELLSKMVEATETPVNILEHVAWVYGRMCDSKEALPPQAEVVKAILPVLRKLIQNSDASILLWAVFSVAKIASGGNELKQLVVDSGVVPHLISLLEHSGEKIQNGALFSIAAISSGTDEQVQLLLDAGVLKKMPSLILHENEEMISTTILFLANAIRGEHQMQAVFDTGLVPVIIQLLVRCPHSREHGVRAISYMACQGDAVHIQHLVDFGVIPLFCNLLDGKKNADLARNIIFTLLCIIVNCGAARIEENAEKIIRYGGLEKIRNLRNHRLRDIRKFARMITGIFVDNKIKM